MENKTGALLLTKNTRKFTEKPSTGSLKSTSTAKEKTVPHYLTSSTGSCHDLCKYGRNSSDGSKEKGSPPPWRSSKGTTFAKKRNPVEPLHVAQRQRNSPGNQKSVEIARKSGAPKITVPKISNPMIRKSHGASMIRNSIPSSPKVSKLPEGLKPTKRTPLYGAGSGEISERLSSSSLRKKAETSSKSGTSMAEKPSLSRLKNLESQGKQHSPLSNLRRPISLVRKFDFSLKPSTPLKSTPQVKRGTSAPKVCMQSSSATVFTRRLFPQATRQIDDLGESKSKDGILHATSLKKSDEEYVDFTKGNSSSVQSSTSSPHSCLSSSLPSLSSSSSPSPLDQDNTSLAEQSLRLGERRSKMGSLNEEEEEARKMRFRAIEWVQSDMADLEPETVVLRHQDMKDKRGNVGLLNHVIEETASKLVETRKSKVKALVGAFETVISLQEGKSVD